jgi:dTDP-4-amino-4,6-dideoxygalactose transaminase
MNIKFSVPNLVGTELHNIAKTYLTGGLGEGGLLSRECEAELLVAMGLPHSKIVVTTSIGSAYDLLSDLLALGREEEVLLPSLMHTSAANAFAKRGAKVTYYDFTQGGYGPTLKLIQEATSDKTRAVVLPHYLGLAEDYRLICGELRTLGILTIEDLSHSFMLASSNGGGLVGGCADFATISFADDQWIHCGEAGALVVHSPAHRCRVDKIRFRGTDKIQFNSAEKIYYDWFEIGGEYSVNEVTAAFLLSQLRCRSSICEMSQRVFSGYREAITEFDRWNVLVAPSLSFSSSLCAPHAFFIELDNEKLRNNVCSGMKRVGIDCRPYIQPLHTTTKGRSYLRASYSLGRSIELASRTLRLPLHYQLKQGTRIA